MFTPSVGSPGDEELTDVVFAATAAIVATADESEWAAGGAGGDDLLPFSGVESPTELEVWIPFSLQFLLSFCYQKWKGRMVTKCINCHRQSGKQVCIT